MPIITIGSAMQVNVEGYGDMTEDVAKALAEIRQEEHQRAVKYADRRQRHIAAVCGTEAPLMEHGQLVAQIDQDVFDHWEAREGRGFFGDRGSRRSFLKAHPECAVRGVSRAPKIIVPDKTGIRGKRGRWAA